MRYLLAAAAAVGVLVFPAGAASQSVTTIGSSTAEACYQAARDHRSGPADLLNCDQALKEMLAPADLVATHVNRGILHALRQDYSKAVSDYDKAISLDPGEAEAFLNKGLLLLRLPGRDGEAQEQLSLAIANKTSKPALAHFARAIAHEGLGDAGAAYRDYQQAALLDPNWELPVRELRRFRTKS